MNLDETANAERRQSIWRLRFSLRTWFLILTLCCVAVFQGYRTWRRNQLERIIFNDASLIYDGRPRHAKPAVTMSSSRGPIVTGPSPQVGLRDSRIPWISRWSGGAVAFSDFDTISYVVGNVPMPEWTNDVLATGELRTASLRLNNPKINPNLLMRCPHLEELTLMGRAHDPHMLRGIHQLRKLKKLTVHSLELKYDQVLPHGLPDSLVEVLMSGCNIQGEDLRMLKNCKKLETLNLVRNPINLQSLADVGLSPNLKDLRLSHCEFQKIDLPLLAKCKQLSILNIDNTTGDLRNIDELDTPKSLEHLSLKGATLDASTFRWLSRLSNLKSLNLNGCQFEDVEAEGIKLSSTLTSFEASDTNAGRHVAAMLADIAGLTSLSLSCESVDDDALRALGAKPELTEIVLRETNISDASAAWLGELKKLKRLDVRKTKVSDRLFEAAPQLTKIASIEVSDTQVGKPLQDAFRQARSALADRANESASTSQATTMIRRLQVAPVYLLNRLEPPVI